MVNYVIPVDIKFSSFYRNIFDTIYFIFKPPKKIHTVIGIINSYWVTHILLLNTKSRMGYHLYDQFIRPPIWLCHDSRQM